MHAAGKYTEFDSASDSTHNLVVDLVPPGARVLEFGCATGYMSEVLRRRLHCSVTGIEYCAEAGELARRHCERVIIGDAESLDFDELLAEERFDAIVFADVLEHLREPAAVLRRVRPFLDKAGVIVASIPNIAHGSMRLALLCGEFRYRDVGLLDNTHLRFFTRESIQDLFEGAGYVVTHWLRRRVGIDGSEIRIPTRTLPEGIRDWITTDPEATTYQFVVRAESTDAAEMLRRMRGEMARASAELDQIRWVGLEIGMLTALIPQRASFILVDENQWGDGEIVPGRRAIPFVERDGRYWGPPADDESAIRELERLRKAGSSFMVVASPAFWWLEYYAGFSKHLRSVFRCVLENERLIVFDLGS